MCLNQYHRAQDFMRCKGFNERNVMELVGRWRRVPPQPAWRVGSHNAHQQADAVLNAGQAAVSKGNHATAQMDFDRWSN